jgi:large subunit ribosomal protein L6
LQSLVIQKNVPMSRIGRQPITIPEEVQLNLEGNRVFVKGPKGELREPTFPELDIKIKDQKVHITRKADDDKSRALHGLLRSLIANAIKGVMEGYKKHLELVGTGYRVKKEGENLVLTLGFSHPVIVKSIEGVSLEAKGQKEIIVAGIDKQRVGQVAANIRKLKKPEPYKGKGIRYKDEVVRIKPGKAAKVGAAQGET